MSTLQKCRVFFVENIQNVLKYEKIYGIIDYLICVISNTEEIDNG